MKISKYINFQQVGALLKKDFLVRIRQPWMMLLQYLWPCVIFLSLYIIRMRFQPVEIENCQFPTRQLPHNDLLPFFQSYICTIENQCSSVNEYKEISDFEEAPVTALLKIVQIFLNEQTLYDAVVDLPKSKNLISLISSVVLHKRFKELEEHADYLVQIFPKVQEIVGPNFNIKNLFADDITFSNSGRVLCGRPFPRSDNIRFVDNILYSEDFNGADDDELRAMPTPYCKKLYRDVTNTNNGKITWKQLKPIIQGKILYGPDNEDTREIISYANKTFHEMGRLREFFKSLDMSVKLMKTDNALKASIASLKNLLNSSFVKNLLGPQANTKLIDGLLDSIVDDPGVEETIATLGNIFECFSANRFIPVETEKEMEDLAYVMNENKTFYAAVYFVNGTDGNEITYKLRMDKDNSPVTIENHNRFYFPGPEASFELEMRYHRGFIQVQNGIDTGIIKFMKNRNSGNKNSLRAEDKKVSSTTESESEDDVDLGLSFDDDFSEEEFDEDDSSSSPSSTTAKTTTDIYSQFADKLNVSEEDILKYGDDTDFESDLDWGDDPWSTDWEERDAIVSTTESDETTTTPEIESTEATTQKAKRRRKRQFDFLSALFGGSGSKKDNLKQTYHVDDMRFYTKQFPYPKYIRDDFKKGLYLAQAVQLSFFFALIIHISACVRHKIWIRESGNLSLMRTMGLKFSSETISWAITTFIEFAIAFMIALIILYSGGLLAMSSKVLVYCYLLVFGLCIISFCYMVSTFFSSASIGSVSAVILFLMTFLPYIIIISLGAVLSITGKILASLSLSTAFCYAWHYILRTELQYRSLDFTNAFSGSLEENDLKFGLTMIVIDIILYTLIGYIYQKKFKTDQKFYKVERKNLHKNLGAQIKGVSKVYPETMNNKPAIDNVSIDFKKDEICCLLGRNGAGKSTIIKMMTGQIEPSSGNVNLPLDYDLITGFTIYQEQIGLCSQNNVLIPNLTAKEHLQLYAKLKLRTGFNAEVRRVMNSLKLGKYRDYKASELSGGYKRRLCIAIAFLGSPNLVILDEPCSGVDTNARKTIWELIENLRKGRAVVLATHFLDEAQHLGDSVIILKDGKIAFESNSTNLQDQLTKSFTLNIDFAKPLLSEQNDSLPQLKKLLNDNVHHFDINSIAENHISIIIPYFNADGQSYDFSSLFHSLENLKRSEKITSFNVISKSLDHLFKSVEDEGQKCVMNGHDPMNNNNMTTVDLGKALNGLNGQHNEIIEFENPSKTSMVSTLLHKRWQHFKRNYRLLLCVLVLPVIFEVIAMGFMKIRPPGDYDNAIEFGRDLYPNSVEFYSKENTDNYTNQIYKEFMNSCSVNQNCEFFDDSKEAFNWVLKTDDQYLQRRYGGITLNNSRSVVWYNNKGYHSMPAYLNVLSSAALKSEMNDNSYNIRTINHPMKLGEKELTISSILQQVADAGISLIMLVAFSLVIAGASVYIVNERVNGEKLQQRLCGVNFATYWGVTFLWDMVVYGIAMFFAFIVFKIFNIGIYVERDNLGGIFLLLFMFGFACIPAVHLFEKLFNDASFANMSFFCLNVVIALTTISMIIVMDVLGESEESEKIRNFLNRLFLIFPQHALADGLIEICKNHITAEIFMRFYINTYKSPVTSDLLRPHYGALFFVGVSCIVINFIIESGIVTKILKKQPKVLKNELKMISIQNTLKKDEKTLSYAEYALKAENLYKRYNSQGYAVKDVSFKVRSGETFGLLGMNGAGKSTIFSILSGDARQCSGNIEFSHLGFNLHGLSYCPQNNALDPLLTVTEIIHFYGKLRNIKDLDQLTEETLKSFHLEAYRNVLVKNLSGGNRRKLSVACSCFGNVNVVLMDEPTSDMDPLTRNLVYKTIKELNDNNCAVILTSHSVSEIEMLCHSVGVLAEGRMIATGSPDILKKKFGNRYVITVFSERPLAPEFEQEIQKQFKNLESLMCHHYSAQFIVHIKYENNGAQEIQKDDLKICFSDLLKQLHNFTSKKDLKYTISECLLDQVYESIIKNEGKAYENNGYIATELH